MTRAGRTLRRRMLLLLALAVAALGGAAWLAAGPDRDDEPATAVASLLWPGAGWRPYAPTSPFNRPVGPRPRIARRSRAMVASMFEQGEPGSIIAIDGSADSRSRDYSRPLYWASRTDPVVRVRCVDYGGRCPVQGARLRIPAVARPAGGSDGHLTVVQPDGRREFSFFRVRRLSVATGRLVVGWGDVGALDGPGTHAGGGAARFGGLAGRIRWEELDAAIRRRSGLDHALFMTVGCSRPRAFVYPATKDERQRGCADTSDAPEMGRRFWLDMTPEEIEALDVPEWLKVVARTMATYGGYVGDQGGGAFGFQFESGESFLARGMENPFIAYAETEPGSVVSGDGVAYFKIREGVPWRERLRALEPPPRR